MSRRFVKNVKIIGSLFMLLFGLSILIVNIVAHFSKPDIRDIDGTYYSMVEIKRYYPKIVIPGSSLSLKRYIIVKTSNGFQQYRVSDVTRFNKNEFVNNIKEGDPIKLQVDDDDYIYSIESKGVFYKTFEESQKDWENNYKLGRWFGVAWIVTAIVCFWVVVEPKFKFKSRRYRRYRKRIK